MIDVVCFTVDGLLFTNALNNCYYIYCGKSMVSIDYIAAKLLTIHDSEMGIYGEKMFVLTER